MSDFAAAVLSGAVEGLELTADEIQFIKKESPAGLTLFARNIDQDNFETVKKLNEDIQNLRHFGNPPFLISIDQEGGRVCRFKGSFPNEGPAMELAGGKSDQEAVDLLRNYGKLLGTRLLAHGVNANFAPVVDVLSNEANDSIGDRAFGKDPGSVVIRAGSFLAGMNSTGILGCLKHFPGQGDGDVDTHFNQANIPHSLEQLERREMFPFKSLLSISSMVMISHAIYPAIDSVEASRSKVWISQILRERLNYKGVVVSDDMTMGAIPSGDKEWKQAVIDSINAGTDLILICKDLHKWQLALDALRDESQRNKAFERRLAEAASRVTKMRNNIVSN